MLSDANDFGDRFGRFLLCAYADGHEMTGQWCLIGEEEFLPDVLVTVVRVGDGERDWTTDEPAGGDVTSGLREFLLREYGDGVEIAGRWEVRYARSSLPDWDVVIDVGSVEPTREEQASAWPDGE